MDNKTYLRAKGWVETPGDTPWRWSDPKAPASFHTIHNAVDLQQARDRELVTKKGK